MCGVCKGRKETKIGVLLLHCTSVSGVHMHITKELNFYQVYHTRQIHNTYANRYLRTVCNVTTVYNMLCYLKKIRVALIFFCAYLTYCLLLSHIKSTSTIGPGRGGTSYLTDFDETWPVQRVPPKTASV